MMGPTVSSADSSALYTLLASLLAAAADPAATKERLDEIRKASDVSQKILDDTVQSTKDAQAHRDAAEKALAETDVKLKVVLQAQADVDGASQRLNDQIAKRDAESSAREIAVAEREKEATARETSLQADADQLDARDQAAAKANDARGAALDKIAEDLDERQTYLDGLVKDYEARMGKLKALAS